MELTPDQIATLAPDAASARAGSRLATETVWRTVGRNESALWGECQGSALYQVRVELATMATRCSCPSRKTPCKHALGLLGLAAARPAAVPPAEPPDWVTGWLSRRAARPAETPADEGERTTPAAQAPARGAARTQAAGRESRVARGLDGLEVWMHDLIRNGLGAVEGQPPAFWERQAARLVDAQAPGLARRVRRLAAIPNATADWPRALLEELGTLALLTEAYRGIERLEPPLREDVRGAIGWTTPQEEVRARGETVRDLWQVVGRRHSTDDAIATRWTWLVGARTGRSALLLAFAPRGRAFEDTPWPGAALEAALTYWPAAFPVRALIAERFGELQPLHTLGGGHGSIETLLGEAARATARQPWLDRYACALSTAVPYRDGSGAWWVRDAAGVALPLPGGEHWELLALSGGRAVDLAGEWDGRAFRPLGTAAEGAYTHLGER